MLDRGREGGEKGEDLDARRGRNLEMDAIPVRVGIGGYNEEAGVPTFAGLAERKGYNQEKMRIEKVRYSHDAMIDMIIADPRITQKALAEAFGYTPAWVSRVMGSDAFQAALAQRREQVTDPFLVATIEERFRGLAMQSADILMRKLEATDSADLALKTLDLSSKAIGFGARERSPGPTINNSFVVALPGKAPDSESWASKYSGSRIEAQPLSSTISRDPLIQPKPIETADSEE